MSIAHEQEVLKSEKLTELFNELQAFLHDSAQRGVAVHEVERVVWREVLRIGRHCLGQFFALHGTGDMGETVAVEGQEWRRLQELHARRYFSIFGEFQLQRAVYGNREGQKIEFAPWTTACSCRRAISPTSCKTGTRCSVLKRRSVRRHRPSRGCWN